ncbi:hypothetical protein G6F56_010131 [Rhizopus delemar]|nr:hypothetical protein G6F56_010131 [Rhizopus delemar]
MHGNDTAYADLLLSHSAQLYNCSKSLQHVRYQFSVPTLATVYGSTDYLDDLVLSSLALYKTTGNQTYLDDTLGYYQLTDWRTNHTEPLDWDNKYGAVYVLLAEALFNLSTPDTSLQRRNDAEKYLDGMVNLTSVNQTKGGLLFWDGYSDDNSNANAMSSCFLLLAYSAKILRPLLSIDPNNQQISTKIQQYENLAHTQLDYIFGKNPLEQNYVVGERSNSPKYPHSALAAGFTSLAEAIANPTDLSHSHTIYGAVVGGPSKNDSFADKRLDWSQTEVALDYNACYQGILAYQVMYSPHGPFYDVDQVTTVHPSEDAYQFPTWALVISIVLPIVFLIFLLGALFLFCRRYRGRRSSGGDGESTVHENKPPIKDENDS